MEADREITYCVNGDPYDRKEEFKKCLIWSPIWPLTLILPCAGHIAIADSKGNVFDFQGTNAIGKNHLLFGYPTRVMQMAKPGVDDVEWDRAVYGAIARYSHQVYDFRTNNCHSFAASALNDMSLSDYKGVHWDINPIMMHMFRKGRFLSTGSMLLSWLPSILFYGAIIALLCIFL
ncbi:hypothetical protein AV274_3621 [Blastocystis sp. ATCC 50177/Nand II]|uniref:Uncharacterized protein n=1 Tax=Blastocystis sp. subtype 1 (strain ATCC 50177 / NandII) TaxID=478820 RepID=A0A196SCD7_BLAHN|nr:hypothetical protein AV274_3621 [Blastocystis sp. ATCC 50177/Nand II]